MRDLLVITQRDLSAELEQVSASPKQRELASDTAWLCMLADRAAPSLVSREFLLHLSPVLI